MTENLMFSRSHFFGLYTKNPEPLRKAVIFLYPVLGVEESAICEKITPLH